MVSTLTFNHHCSQQIQKKIYFVIIMWKIEVKFSHQHTIILWICLWIWYFIPLLFPQMVKHTMKRCFKFVSNREKKIRWSDQLGQYTVNSNANISIEDNVLLMKGLVFGTNEVSTICIVNDKFGIPKNMYTFNGTRNEKKKKREKSCARSNFCSQWCDKSEIVWMPNNQPANNADITEK